LYDEFEEHVINGCVQNKTILTYAKNHGNEFRHFEDISRRCEPSDMVAYFLGPPCMSCVFLHLFCAVETWTINIEDFWDLR